MPYYHTSQFNLYLQESNIPNAGLGVYTHNTIPTNTRIDEYKGIISRFTGGAYALELINGYRIDARELPRCYMGMINDCSHIKQQYKRKKGRNIDITPAAYYDSLGNPLEINCEFVICYEGQLAYVHSIKEIMPGQELFISYGKDYWKN
jgi:hypothetical protein